MDWYRNLSHVLRQEKTEYVLSEPYPKDPPSPASSSVVDRRAHEKRYDDALNISCLMPTTMSHDL
jgi:hypothetical protein